METKTAILIESAVAIIILITALVLIIWNTYKHWKANDVRGWPKARGEIISALVKPSGSPTGTEYLRPSEIRPIVGSQTSYVPRVTYTYRVKGNQYRNDDLMYNGPDTYSDVDIQTYMGRYRPGARVVVYYNPGDPSDSYLYTGEVDWWPIWVGVILLLIAGAVGGHAIYLHRKEKKKEEKAEAWNPFQMNLQGYDLTQALNQRGGADMY